MIFKGRNVPWNSNFKAILVTVCVNVCANLCVIPIRNVPFRLNGELKT